MARECTYDLKLCGRSRSKEGVPPKIKKCRGAIGRREGESGLSRQNGDGRNNVPRDG